jgi:hypothetical protein
LSGFIAGLAMKSILKPLAVCLSVAITTSSIGQQSLFHRAENGVEIALISVKRTSDYTEIHLQTLAASRGGVCWYKSGPDSPYLIADERRLRFIGGDNITSCPDRRRYAEREVMVLRFEPMPQSVREFSLVEGEGGEDQMRGHRKPNETFWNFLYVKLN